LRCLSVSPSVVSLSCGSTRLHCAKTAERIRIVFGVNTLESPWNVLLHGSPDSQQRGTGIRCSLHQITLASCIHMRCAMRGEFQRVPSSELVNASRSRCGNVCVCMSRLVMRTVLPLRSSVYCTVYCRLISLSPCTVLYKKLNCR